MSSRNWLIAIALLLLAASTASGYASHGRGNRDIYTAAAWLLYVLTFCWMKADARRRLVEPPPGAIPLIPWLLPVAVPYYLLATRRGWSAALSLCIAVGVVAVFCTVLLLGEYVGSTAFSYARGSEPMGTDTVERAIPGGMIASARVVKDPKVD